MFQLRLITSKKDLKTKTLHVGYFGHIEHFCFILQNAEHLLLPCLVIYIHNLLNSATKQITIFIKRLSFQTSRTVTNYWSFPTFFWVSFGSGVQSISVVLTNNLLGSMFMSCITMLSSVWGLSLSNCFWFRLSNI